MRQSSFPVYRCRQNLILCLLCIKVRGGWIGPITFLRRKVSLSILDACTEVMDLIPAPLGLRPRVEVVGNCLSHQFAKKVLRDDRGPPSIGRS